MNNKVAKSENTYDITLTTAEQIIKIIKKSNKIKQQVWTKSRLKL